MNPLVVYLLLLKSTLLSFSGLAGLPIIREDFVVARHVLTDSQLNVSVAVGRTVPGPNGLYVVCAGYYAAGIPGAIAGGFALMTPAFLIIVLLIWVGRHAENPTTRRVISSVLLASAGLIVATTLQLAKSAVVDGFSAIVATASFLAMAFTPIDTMWLMLFAAAIGLTRRALGLS